MILALFFSALALALGDRTQSDAEYWRLWKQFKTYRHYGDIESKAEHDERFEIFKDNVDTITRHNLEGHSWTMGLTKFADMTKEEFKEFVGGECQDTFAAKKSVSKMVNRLKQNVQPNVNNPSSVDWTAAGRVTPVKNQGGCGSCWAFSATGSIEARTAISKGTSPDSLSEQELVDCSTADAGCDGGIMDDGFKYAQSHNGLSSETAYPYEAVDQTCAESGKTHIDPVSGYVDVSGGESGLETAVVAGPVSVAIEADQTAFQFYDGGIMSGTCGTGLDHGVLVTGYYNDGASSYWLVKNSWGSSWGESGYIKLCKDCGKNSGYGQCGVAEMPSYPTV